MTTPTIERCKEANYQPFDGNQVCWHCKFSETKQYAGGGTKFVCNKLNIQTHKGYSCKYFAYPKAEMKE